MTYDQIISKGVTLPRTKPSDDVNRIGYRYGQSIARFYRIEEKKAERRRAIKARWNRYRRLCGLPLSNK